MEVLLNGMFLRRISKHNDNVLFRTLSTLLEAEDVFFPAFP